MNFFSKKILVGYFFLAFFANFSIAADTPLKGNITYTLHKSATPSDDEQDAYNRITTAMDSAVKIYNTYASLTKHINVYYSTGVPTAEASSNGDLRFGKERSYMFVGTAMHEMAHTLGMGTTQDYKNMLKDGVFQGEKAQAKLKELTGDNSQVLKGDAQHFWPYGLNYASEVKSEQDLIFHAQIVEAMYQDIFKEAFYMDGRIKSVATGKCIGMESDNSLKLMDCKDEGTVAKLFSIGEPVSYRIQYGTRVIDVPNESTAAGVTLSTYGWNGGAHQKYFMETTGENGHFYLRNAKSGHYIQAVSDHLEQNPSDKGESFLWVILDGSVKDSTDEEPPSAITKKWGRAPYFINSDGWGVDVKGRGQKKAKYRVIF